jgi:DNA-binding HxlR family transcriptional regulator
VDSGPIDPVREPSAAAEAEPAEPDGGPSACRAREVLQRVGDKWSMYVIDLLGQGTMRGLERDGIVTRTIHPVIPPRVDYALTPMGLTLLDAIGALVSWADSHLPEISAAQAVYDARRRPD